MTLAAPTACPRCQAPLPASTLACAECGALAFGPTLERLSAEAQWQAKYNPVAAAAIWQECLKLLPADSRQYAAVQAQIDHLAAAPQFAAPLPEPGGAPAVTHQSLPAAIAITGISMLVSIVVYQFQFGWAIAIGFVLLILIHELGHVIANRHYHLPASPPIFIPYIGAVINLRQAPPNARVEAVVGIAGPVAGAIASLAAFGWYCSTEAHVALVLAWFGFSMNLFNLLPVPPMDGGRVAAAVSPWIWVLGIAGLATMLYDEIRGGGGTGILLLIAVVALPRILRTLKRDRKGPYYAIGRESPILIGAAYLLLLGLLLALDWHAQSLLHIHLWL